MKRGAKPQLPTSKAARATTRADRDQFELIEAPAGELVRPDGLSLAAQTVWDDLAPMAVEMGTLKPCDVFTFSTLCDLIARIQMTWQGSEPAPAAYLAEARRLGELFGLAGERSRVTQKAEAKSSNAFAANGRWSKK